MKMSVKRLVGNAWHPIPIEELKGKSISCYLTESKDVVVAACFDNEEVVAFISNSDEYVSMYRDKGASFHVNDIKELLGSVVVPHIILEELPGSHLMEVSRVEDQQSLPLV